MIDINKTIRELEISEKIELDVKIDSMKKPTSVSEIKGGDVYDDERGDYRLKSDRNLKINTTNIGISGTSLQGKFNAFYDTLVKKLGEPIQTRNERDGTQVEWHIAKDGIVATIYDYKDSHYPKYITDWNIGGFSKEAVKLVNNLLK